METINKNLICYDNGTIVCELNNYVGKLLIIATISDACINVTVKLSKNS